MDYKTLCYIGYPKNKAFVNGKDAELTAKEFSLLLLLMKNEDKVFSPGELYEAVWGMPSANDTRTIRFHIRNLKKKIDTENSKDYDIVSIYGKGYSFTAK
jgi:DNA-binding response OmpR family regulator